MMSEIDTAYIVRPRRDWFGKDGEYVPIQAWLPAEKVSPQQIDSFRREHCTDRRLSDQSREGKGRWVVIERFVRVLTSSGVTTHAKTLAEETKHHFGFAEVQIH